MEWYVYIAVVVAGLIAGFINTLAGSGSLITLPLLMFLGLPANIANATNRVGVLVQSFVGAWSFRQQKLYAFRESLPMAIPATIGSIIGALFAVRINERIMELFIGGLLLVMFFIILYRPEEWVKEHAREITGRHRWWVSIVFLFVGFYGGFIQAGVGFFLLGALVLSAGMDLTKANALKLVIVFLFTIVALLIFIVSGQVNYFIGLILAAGQGIGAWLASRVAVKWGPRVVRIVLLVAIMGSALKLTGVIDLIIRLF